MKKEYHLTLSRTDRIYLTVFVLLLLGWELIKYAMPEKEIGITKMQVEIGPSNNPSIPAQSRTTRSSKFRNKTAQRSFKPKTYASAENLPEPKPVEIPTASAEELRAIGLSSKVVYNIQKYLQAGGSIRDETGLSKIFGMDSVQLHTALPYIIFPPSENRNYADPDRPDRRFRTDARARLDLNLATAAELQTLNGIGPVLAGRIIKFRESLGGFHTLDQLQECYGLPPETLSAIAPRLTLAHPPDRIPIKDIQTDSLRHPYLTPKMARILKAYKKQHGDIRTLSELRQIFPPDTAWCERLLPYLAFDE